MLATIYFHSGFQPFVLVWQATNAGVRKAAPLSSSLAEMHAASSYACNVIRYCSWWGYYSTLFMAGIQFTNLPVEPQMV